MVEPNTPVIVGAGQVSQREVDRATALQPVDLLAEAARAAERDSSARRSLLSIADTVAVVGLTGRRYPDPGAFLARRLGVDPIRTITTTVGGNSPQLLVNEMSAQILAGESRCVLIGGVECFYTRMWARRAGFDLGWELADDPPCPNTIGDDRPGTNDYESTHSATIPVQIYPMLETAVRGHAGRDIHSHQVHVSELWSHFSQVASHNPHAWSQEAFSAEEIRTPGPDNRWVAFPYTKRMCANIQVDQAAAFILTSFETASEAGVPDDRIVFVHSGADANDHYHFSERWSLAESPAIAAVGKAVLEAAGITIDDVARFDLYSCFPSAVEVAMTALGLKGPLDGDLRQLTVTGGLAFAGGPGNNYVSHSIAAMIDACRRDPGSSGMVTGLGWYISKHSAGIYSANPPKERFARVDPSKIQPVVDAGPRREAAGPHDGQAVAEAYTVLYDRDGARTLGILTALIPNGRRALANTHDPVILESLTTDEWTGRTVRLRSEGEINLLDA